MDKLHKILLFFSMSRVLGFTIGETIHFTNNPDRVMSNNFTSYQLDVPGSKPITIYEANAVYSNQNKDTLSPYSDYSDIPKQPYMITKRVSNGPTYHAEHESESYNLKPFPFNVDLSNMNEGVINNFNRKNITKKTVFSPTLLETFLQNYEKDTTTDDTQDPEFIQNMERNNKRPYNKNNGWISLDAVPTFSSGKVYKWHSNSQKYHSAHPSYSHHNYDEEEEYFNNRPYHPQMHENNFEESNFDEEEGYQLPPKPFGSVYPDKQRPYSHRPTTVHNNKPYYASDYNSDKFQQGYHGAQKRPHRDIITDNRPSNFPAGDNRRYGSTVTDKPSTYPKNGNGQWVLISTTKGQGQTSRQTSGRSFTTNPSNVSTVLRVLPNAKSRNITTSNGEVIEVAESGRGHSNAEPTTRSPKRKIGTQMAVIGSPHDNTGTILAAVGAGLVPASLAIVAPMVLGRRRRDISFKDTYNFQKHPILKTDSFNI